MVFELGWLKLFLFKNQRRKIRKAVWNDKVFKGLKNQLILVNI